MRRKAVLTVLALLLAFIGGALPLEAQGGESCPAIVETALAVTDSACGMTGRNQACYGHVQVEAEPGPDVADLVFEQSGDIVDVAALAGLRLSAMDAGAGVWGVALMRVQANLPDTLPGQNVTLLLFGDVAVQQGTIPAPPALTVTSTGAVNVRGGPSVRDAIVGALTAGQQVVADGRLDDFSWLRIQWEDGHAWVFTDLVTPSGDLTVLEAVDPAAEPMTFGPMQAFYFSTGLGDAPCAEAPDSGLLIQTPEGAGEVTLLINEVTVRLGSTAYLQAQAGGEMRACAIEGGARLEAFDQGSFALAGTCTRVPLDENLAAAGPPGPPEPYDPGALAGLPLGLLERDVEVAPPLSAEEAARLTIVPFSGTWMGAFRDSTLNCPNEFARPVDLSASNGPRTLTFSRDGAAATLEVPGWGLPPLTFARTGPDVYSGVAEAGEGSVEAITWQIVDREHIEGLSVITLPDGCVINAPFDLTYTGQGE